MPSHFGHRLARFYPPSKSRDLEQHYSTILLVENRLTLAVAIKTKCELPNDDIVEVYLENIRGIATIRAPPVSAVEALHQINGYMWYNELQCGILSTYERTWFLYRPKDNPNELRVRGCDE